MIIEVLVCRIDGTQVIERREVPDDWFSEPGKEEENSSEVEGA